MLTNPPTRAIRPPAALALALLAVALGPTTVSATGGTPGPSPQAAEVCVIAPRLEAGEHGRPSATLPLSRPTIFVRDPLAQVRLMRGGRVIWQLQAAPREVLQGPLPWPLEPLRPGERLQLQLQPIGSAGDAFATIDLQASSGATLARNDARLAALGNDPQAWQRAVAGALQQGETALATALLFAFDGPSAPDLDALRLEAFQRSCR
jgi:hypothetical protein